MNWYFEVLKKYADFNGRARRKEFWYFSLFSSIIGLLTIIIDDLIGTTSHGFGLLSIVYDLAIFLPAIGVYVRRLHDTNRSGWWVLISLIPIVGFIVLLIFLVQDSQPGENEYGKNPKDLTSMNAPQKNISNITPAATDKFCPQCGQKVAISDKFCENCGHGFV